VWNLSGTDYQGMQMVADAAMLVTATIELSGADGFQ